jgi:hypothetical protein
VEMAERLAADMGVAVQFVETTWAGLVRDMSAQALFDLGTMNPQLALFDLGTMNPQLALFDLGTMNPQLALFDLGTITNAM